MKNNLTVLSILISILFMLPAQIYAQNGQLKIWEVPPLNDMLHEALQQNKQIQSLTAQVESRKAQVPFAASLEDPRLGMAILNLPTDSYTFDQEAMTQKQISISQKFPWFGKLDLKKQQALLAAKREEISLQDQKLALVREISTTFFDLAFINESLTINAKLHNKVGQILQVAEMSYAAGRGLQQDVLQAQVEMTKLLNEKIVLTQQQRTRTQQLHILLNRHKKAALQLAKDLHLPVFELLPEELIQIAHAHNPSLQIQKINMAMGETNTKLAQKTYWPDLDVKLAYSQRDESEMGQERSDFVSATITMNIPLWQKNRQQHNVTSNRLGYQAALRSYQNLHDTLPNRIEILYWEIKTHLENYHLYTKGLLLQAEQAAQSSLAAYEVGNISFDAMINSQVRLLNLELKAQKYRFEAYKKWGELAELCGVLPDFNNTELPES